MVKLISGSMGSGKTKQLIKMANEKSETSKGNIVFIDDDKRHMYDLTHDVRFVCMEEFPIHTVNEFVGFICGIISNDYDIDHIYIDGLCKVMDCVVTETPQFIARLEELGKQFDISFVATVSCDTLPEELKGYILD